MGIIKRLIGGLNLDNNVNDVPPMDFIDGYDVVDRNPTNSSEDKYLQPENNNEFAYNLGVIEEPQGKIYRITIDISNIIEQEETTISMKFYGKYGWDWTLNFNYVAGDTTNDLFTEIEGVFLSYGLDAPQLVLASATTLVFDVQLSNFFAYTDFFISMSDNANPSAVYTVQVLQDAISVEKTGALVPIEFTNVSSDQQVWATTKSKEIEIIIDVSGAAAGASDPFYLSFTNPTDIVSGEEVYMYGNGVAVYVVLQLGLSAGQYTIWGSIDPITNTNIFSNGDYTIVRNKRTASVIGYARKNYLNDEWSYTELIRSINLNFRTYKQIQAYAMITNNGTIYNWTDYLNQIKRLYYFGEILSQGFLTVYNTEAIYDLDTIGQESNLQLGTNTAKVSLFTSAGTGSKLEGNYVAFVRFKTADGFYTTYSKASNVQWLRSGSVENHKPTLRTTSSLGILVEQINFNLFESVQVSIIHFTDASWTGYSLPEQSVNGLSEIEIVDTGFNSLEYLDFNDANFYLEQIPFVFENAKTILPYALYEVAANVNLIRDRDLTEWAKTIQLSVQRREYFGFTYSGGILGGLFPSDFNKFIFSGINELDKCSNEWMSYMPYDHYRFCVFVDWEDGSPTSTYWIDDVSFNPVDNPSITNGDASINKVSTTISYYQYYVNATNINLDYILPSGEYLREIIKDIRFGRALCNPQVYSTGLTIAFHDPDALNDYPYALEGSKVVPSSDLEPSKFVLYSPDLQNTASNFSFNTKFGDRVVSYQCAFYGTNTYPPSVTPTPLYPIASSALRSSPSSVSFADVFRSIPAANGQWTEIGQMTETIAPVPYNTDNNIGYQRGGVTVELASSLVYTLNSPCRDTYYIRPYPTAGAYTIAPENTKFFVIPQDKWFDKQTHTSSTVYSIYGGDAFPNPSVYMTRQNNMLNVIGDLNYVGNAVLFFSFNRTNAALRAGRYPYITLEKYLTEPYLTAADTDGDSYTYSQAFTPRYPFQNQVAFNPELKQITKLGSSIFYSEQAVSYDLAGGNRLWGAANRKDLEATYGDIIHMEILLGFSETGLLIVWQPERTTAQYFDNTANLKSSAGDLLIGNGAIMARKGVDFTEYGCEHKWTIIKGQNPAGKDVVYWACFRKGAIMRLGADGTADLVGDINNLLTNKTFLALQNIYNNEDIPAHNFGCHAVWNNQTKEYILTLTLVPKTIVKRTYTDGDWATSGETWGFENLPVMYKSIGTNNFDPPFGSWEEHKGYDDDAFQIWTMVWNEIDNKFKTFRTFNPKIYGQFNNTYVSSHPNYPNLIYEHNKNKNEALFYCTLMKYEVEAVTNPALFRIEGAGIESILPSIPFTPDERTKWVVKIEDKNFEIVGGGTDYLQMANVDNDDILPDYTFYRDFIYYICNSQDPYIEGVVNEAKPRYIHFVGKNTQSDDTLKRTEYYAGYDSLGTVTTESFTNKVEEEFYNGESNVQIKNDTTNNPTDNEIGENVVQGKWMKLKNIFRWGKKNRLYTLSINAIETLYKKQ